MAFRFGFKTIELFIQMIPDCINLFIIVWFVAVFFVLICCGCKWLCNYYEVTCNT